MAKTTKPIVKNDTHRQKEVHNELVFSYMTLRNLIGFSGMLLPLILIITTNRGLNDRIVEPSISDYYYTSNGDVVVVLLSILGVFLFTYKGYNKKENILTILAAICSIGVAFSPTVTKYGRSSFSVHTTNDAVPTIFGLELHLIYAAVFFITLALISLIYFPRSYNPALNNRMDIDSAKGKRNIVFKVCGWIMLICVMLLAVYFMSDTIQFYLGNIPVIFILETIAIEAFGISWITKGETLWPDGKHYFVRGYERARQNLKQ